MTTPIDRGQTAAGIPWPGTNEPLADTPTFIRAQAEAIDKALGTGGRIAFGYFLGNVQTGSIGQFGPIALSGLPEGVDGVAVTGISQPVVFFTSYPYPSSAAVVSGTLRSPYAPAYLGYSPPPVRNSTVGLCAIGWKIKPA